MFDPADSPSRNTEMPAEVRICEHCTMIEEAQGEFFTCGSCGEVLCPKHQHGDYMQSSDGICGPCLERENERRGTARDGDLR